MCSKRSFSNSWVRDGPAAGVVAAQVAGSASSGKASESAPVTLSEPVKQARIVSRHDWSPNGKTFPSYCSAAWTRLMRQVQV